MARAILRDGLSWQDAFDIARSYAPLGCASTTGFALDVLKEKFREKFISEEWFKGVLADHFPNGKPYSHSRRRSADPKDACYIRSLAESRVSPAIYAEFGRRFYRTKDIVREFRSLKRSMKCGVCLITYHEYLRKFQDDLIGWRTRNTWLDLVFLPRGKSLKMWTCSLKCREKFETQKMKEKEWLKTAQQKQTEVRRWLRNNHEASSRQRMA